MPVESDPVEREELMLQADMLSGLNAAKFNQVFSNLCNACSGKKFGKFAKNARAQKESNDLETMNGFQLIENPAKAS